MRHCQLNVLFLVFFFFQAEDGIRDIGVTGVQTCALPISSVTVSLKLAMFSVAPPATVTDEVSAMRSAAPSVRVPPPIVVAPVNVFAPPSVSVPLPVFVKEPVPLMTPENVPDELSAPAVSAPVPSVTLPAPVSDATDAVKPFRSSTAPLAREST